MKKLFGTDGVRGVANLELTPELAFGLARAQAHYLLGQGVSRPRLLIGQDTRCSSDLLACAFGGILPTPAVAYLTRSHGCNGGVMISASHNPVPDNGIKLFAPDGYKLNDQASRELEALIANPQEIHRPTGTHVGHRLEQPTLMDDYLSYLVSLAPVRLEGIKVVLDCGYGAAYLAAPALLRRLGAEVVAIHAEADGSRINVNCGSTNLSSLSQEVIRQNAQLGLAFDGDADRCLAVDERGHEVDGDRMLLIFARWMQSQGRLQSGGVVATVMSNFGLEHALTDSGIVLHRAQVGDRYVLEKMHEVGANLGGEQSGHLLFLDHATTGDGAMSGMLLACCLQAQKASLAELSGQLRPLPQKLVNIRAEGKDRLAQDPEITHAIETQEKRLAGRGRLLVRPSGTEPLIRLMAEGPDLEELDEILADLATLVQSRLAGTSS